mgnify:CR=1 FL=1
MMRDRMTGIGMYAVVFNDDDGLAVGLAAARSGKLSDDEQRAKAMLSSGERRSRLMTAAMLEELATLIPVRCGGCGGPGDIASMVEQIRKGAVVS